MAVYQYYLAVVPGNGILKRHESKPDSIGVSTETGYFESDAEIYWKIMGVKVDDILPKIDRIVKRANWGNEKTSFNWKIYTDELDNDASIYLDDQTLAIAEFSFRADLRESGLTFLMNMIELGKENYWMFMDRSGKLMNPDFEEIKVSIRDSNAYSFLKDPIKFLENVDKNK